MRKRRWIILLFSAAFLFVSCATREIQLKPEEIKSNLPNILLLEFPPAKMIYAIPQGDASNAKRLRESFPYKLKSVSGMFNDSLNKNLDNILKYELDSLGFNVYSKNDIIQFQQNGQNAFVIEPVYSELRERHLLYLDRYDDGDNEVFFDTTYTSLEFTLRFKVYPVNDSSLAEPVLSATVAYSDIPEGYWEWSNRNQSWSYVFSFTQAETSEIPFFAGYTVRQAASYFRDFFINLSLNKDGKNMVKKRRVYYTVSNDGKLKEAGKERFLFE